MGFSVGDGCICGVGAWLDRQVVFDNDSFNFTKTKGRFADRPLLVESLALADFCSPTPPEKASWVALHLHFFSAIVRAAP